MNSTDVSICGPQSSYKGIRSEGAEIKLGHSRLDEEGGDSLLELGFRTIVEAAHKKLTLKITST